MKITAISLATPHSSITVNARTPGTTDPYLIKSITGLDADDIAQRYYGQALNPSDAQYYGLYDMVQQKREPSFQIALNPDFTSGQTVSDLRDALYKLIAGSRTGKITVTFINGTHNVATLEGYVSKFESTQFSDEPYVTISLNCKDTFLRSRENEVHVSPTSLNASTVAFDITDSLSTAPHGCIFAVQFTNTITCTSWRIDNLAEGWYFKIDYSDGFLAGDILRFSSEYNYKYLFLNGYPGDPNPVRRHYSIIDLILQGSIWPTIFPGVNHFDFNRGVGSSETFQWLNFSYWPTYWGI